MKAVRTLARVVHVHQVARDMALLALEGGVPGAEPGQFALLRPASWRSEPYLPRPMSFLSVQEGRLEFLVRRVGLGTNALLALEPGDGVWVLGPLGVGWPRVAEGVQVVLVAGGVGLAPLLFWLEQERRPAQVLYGVRTRQDLALVERIEAAGGRLVCATEDGSAGRQGLVTALVGDALSGTTGHVLACGPWPMMRVCVQAAVDHGWRCHVSLEARMACGLGMCLGCAVPRAGGGYLYACREGPVVEGSTVDWGAEPPV